ARGGDTIMSVLSILVNGELFDVEVVSRSRDSVTFNIAGRTYRTSFADTVPHLPAGSSGGIESAPGPAASTQGKSSAIRRSHSKNAKPGEVHAPIPGVISEILCTVGAKVDAGAILLRLEAMKMQNSIFAPVAGSVAAIHVASGEEVGDGALLITLTPKQSE
ncbi:MAG: hypothetical protein KDD69_17870, partial [Bdellovibrionales bacterium]|nr:hypothetical protein [Bdellovibrionales bacterium]